MVSLKFYFSHQSKKCYTFEAADALSKVLAVSQIVLCCFVVVDLSRKLRPILVQNVFQRLETEMNPSVLMLEPSVTDSIWMLLT